MYKYREKTEARKNSRGFSLVDVMISMAIFSVGILAVAGMQVSATNSNSASRNVTDMTIIGTNVLETLRTRPFDHADLEPTTNPHEEMAAGGYIVRWDVTDVDLDQNGINESKRVDLRVVHPRTGQDGFAMRYLVPNEGG